MDTPNLKHFFKANRIAGFFLSPFFLALVISLAIILALPSVGKYKLEIIEQFRLDKTGGVSFYDDLDSDGHSEYLISYPNGIGEHSVKLTTYDGRLIDTWNFYKLYPPRNSDCPIFSGDYNNDGFKEVYAISWKGDSIFLDIITPMDTEGLQRRNIFIDKIGSYNDKPDFRIKFEQLYDFDHDGLKDLIFGIHAGYSIQPRQLYIYNIREDTMLKSPQTGVTLHNIKICDLDDDSFSEITGNTTGSGNIGPDMGISYRDSSSWLMVYDHHLKFEFEPLEYPVYKSVVSARPVQYGNEKYIIAATRNEGLMEVKEFLITVTPDGKIIQRKTAEDCGISYPTLVDMIPYNINDPVYLLDKASNLFRIDDNLTITNLNRKCVNGIYKYNLDVDREYEYLTFNSENNQLTIFNALFRDETTVRIISNLKSPFKISVIRLGHTNRKILVQLGNQCFILNYSKNPWYYFIWFVYAGIFPGIWLLIWLIRRYYRNQLLKQDAIKREITQLQFQSINNQINPHFIFNAMNSITSAIYKENREEAYKFGTKFSNLMREALMSSDAISRSLEKEVAFVKNYLDLEKFRFKGVFDYEFSIDPDVDLKTEVPKMIIQTFAENAVKHGMRGKVKDGMIKIGIDKNEKGLLITVEDNGSGMEADSDKPSVKTGKGLKITEEIFDLYRTLNKTEISYRTRRLHPGGTLVEVFMKF